MELYEELELTQMQTKDLIGRTGPGSGPAPKPDSSMQSSIWSFRWAGNDLILLNRVYVSKLQK
jgi:hypothetical protein